jgi:hypothetical protein
MAAWTPLDLEDVVSRGCNTCLAALAACSPWPSGSSIKYVLLVLAIVAARRSSSLLDGVLKEEIFIGLICTSNITCLLLQQTYGVDRQQTLYSAFGPY